jgi:hypothetical protein
MQRVAGLCSGARLVLSLFLCGLRSLSLSLSLSPYLCGLRFALYFARHCGKNCPSQESCCVSCLGFLDEYNLALLQLLPLRILDGMKNRRWRWPGELQGGQVAGKTRVLSCN